jgi:hypothetical protein
MLCHDSAQSTGSNSGRRRSVIVVVVVVFVVVVVVVVVVLTQRLALGIYFSKPAWVHGLLYVAASRVRSSLCCFVVSGEEMHNCTVMAL